MRIVKQLVLALCLAVGSVAAVGAMSVDFQRDFVAVVDATHTPYETPCEELPRHLPRTVDGGALVLAQVSVQ